MNGTYTVKGLPLGSRVDFKNTGNIDLRIGSAPLSLALAHPEAITDREHIFSNAKQDRVWHNSGRKRDCNQQTATLKLLEIASRTFSQMCRFSL